MTTRPPTRVERDDQALARRAPNPARITLPAFLALAALHACSTTSSAEPAAPPSVAERAKIPRDADGEVVNPFRIGRPLVIAHAGGDALFPENTLYAYEQSSLMGSEVIDIDVQVTADGVPVAIHDRSVDRTTDGSGRVAEMTAAEVTALDAGYMFERGGEYPFRGQGITVPTVEAVVERYPDALITLDMKDQRIVAVAPVCDLVRRADRGPRLYVGIDVDEQVIEFRRLCPEVYTSGTSAERAAARAARETGDPDFRSEQLVGQPGYLDDDGTPRITRETLEFSHRMGTAILTWVIDDRETMHHLIDIGIDGIYTRRPDVLVDVLRERGLLPAA